ncbi:response regulator [Pseudanabaena biceps]|nr:response regulator [Pseudanabaena biceps]
MQKSPPLKVLVVEDQALLALQLEMTLLDLGCEVVGCAMDTAAALEIAAQESPELAFVDINLRDGCTGPLIAAALGRDFGATSVFVTANPEQATGAASGALGVICKPFDTDTISGVVRFVEIYRREQRLTPVPPRFRIDPGLLALAPPGRRA